MSKEASAIINALKPLMRKTPISNDPKGLPNFMENADNALDGNYRQENLMDEGIRNMVTGSGRGPVLGGAGRGLSYGTPV